MRHAVLLLLVASSVAHADDTTPKKPKGHLVNPWARMPHPRDHMRLPDPRKAAEKAAADGVVAPVAPEPAASDPEPPPEPPVAEPIIAIPAAAIAPVPPARTPFGTTTLAHVEPAPVAPHSGLTLEAAIGFGAIYVSDRNHVVSSPGGVGGLDLGFGGWLQQDVALTLRIAGSSTPSAQGTVVAAFIGPSLQIWPTQETWFGIGFGLATLGIDSSGDANDYSLDGPGLDLRLGHTIYARGSNTLNGSVEFTPSSVSDGGGTLLGVASAALLLGWQYL